MAKACEGVNPGKEKALTGMAKACEGVNPGKEKASARDGKGS